MIDITMCASQSCEDRAICYRNPASGTKPSEHQSWADFGGEDNFGCAGYIPVKFSRKERNMQTDPETIDALVGRLRAEIAELRSWKAAEGAHHQLLRQQAKEGFAAGVEAAAEVAQGVCDKDLSPSDGVIPTDVLDAIRAILQTSAADGK